MNKFYFQAVTEDGKQISGYIEATDLEGAREKLKENRLSILTLEEKNEDQSQTKGKFSVYEFEGMSDQHKKVRGTIEAIDRFAAFKKLRVNYNLEVFYLVDTKLQETEKAKSKEAGIEKELEDELILELKIAEKKNKKNHQKSNAEDDLKSAVEANEKERQYMVDKIDGVLGEIVPLLEENSDYIDPNKKREIEDRLNLLIRLKHSNSVDHLKSLTKRLLKQIGEDEIFLQDANIPEELQAEINRRKSQFQAVGAKFDKLVSRSVVGLEESLKKIDVQELKWVLNNIRIIQGITNVFYSIFGWILTFISGLFLFYTLKALLGWDRAQSLTWLQSPLLWYSFGVSLLFLSSYYFIRINPKNVWWYSFQVAGIYALCFIVYTVQFPTIFFWTNSFV